MNEELPFLQKDIDDNKLMTVLIALFPILFFIPLIDKKGSRYETYFANQSLLVFIAAVVCAVVPILGWLVEIVVTVMWIMNIIHAVQAVPDVIPIIGKNIIIKYDNLA